MLGELLRVAREKAGFTQEELAHRAGVDRTYVSQLEHDKKSPTIQMLFRLCNALGESPAVIIGQLEQTASRKGGRKS